MRKALKSLFRKGDANLIKILCLGVGLAIGLVMLAEVLFERSYDHFIPRLTDTYRIEEHYRQKGTDWGHSFHTAGAIAPGIKQYCPEVEAATRFTNLNIDMKLMTEDRRMITGDAYLCDSAFFDVFPRKILMGEDPHTGLEKSNNAYISRKLMETLGEDILGKTLSWKEFPNFRITVTGVFEDFPENTHLPQMDILIALPTIGQVSYDGRDRWLGNDRYSSYIRLRHDALPDALDSGIARMMEVHINDDLKESGTDYQLTLQRVDRIFAASDYNRTMNIVFLAFALIMLAVAVLNYVLLTISSMVNRAKGIATYRCYGAENRHIYRMILSESALHSLIGLALAVLVVFSLQDFLQEQMGHSLASLFPASTILTCIGVTLLIVGVCGAIPGYLYAHIPVTYAYRRYSESKRHWKLGLLFVQFLLTTLFVSLLTVISLQYHKLTNFETGFEYKHILYVSLPGTTTEEQERCVQELKKLPNVAGVTWGYQEMFLRCSGNNVYNPETGEEYMNIADMYDVGPDYHKTFDIPVIEGSVFNPALQDSTSRQVMVSHSFVERMQQLAGWSGSPIGRQVHITEHQGTTLSICGVYEDIHLGSQVSENYDERPTVMFYRNRPAFLLYIRLQQMGAEAIQEVQDVVTRTMPSQDKQVYSLDWEMGNLYNMVLHVRNSIFFAGICILIIALIGLIAYLRDEVNRRRAEIAIRTIHGAKITDIQRLFLKDLLKVAAPAVLAGSLIAYFLSVRLLELFAAKIPLTVSLFAACLLGVLLLVAVIAARMIQKAARSNPTDNLRTE